MGLAGNIGQVNYATTQAGIIGFTRSLALEVARYSITVKAVCSGFIRDDMLLEEPEDVLQRIPLARFGTAEEVANCVRNIVAEGGYMTGQVLSVNGGLYI